MSNLQPLANGNVRAGGNSGMIAVKSLAELQRDDQEKIEAEHNAGKKALVVTSLSSYINNIWQSAYEAKQEHRNAMYKAKRQRDGIYEADIQAVIANSGGSDIFMGITDVKCRAAEAWISEILAGKDRIWGLESTAIPELSGEQKQAMFQQAMELINSQGFAPEQAKQMLDQAKVSIQEQLEAQAKTATEKMIKKIEDQFQECKFDEVLGEFINDVVTYKAGFIKGPIVTKKATLKWGENFQPIVGEEITVEVKRLSPLDVYPAAHATTVDDGDMMIEHKLTSDDLYKMIGIKGNKEDAIRRVLDLYGDTGFKGWNNTMDSERDRIEGRTHDYGTKTGYLQAVEFRGMAQGKKLIEWGIDTSRIDDPLRSYSIEAWMIGHEVVRCVLNGDPLGKKPISKASAVNIPGSFWGKGLPELIEDQQRMCNAAARALGDNMGIASGPQVAVDATALPDGEQITNIYPWKVWQIKQSANGNGGMPISFFQPQMHSGELLNIYERFARYADEVSGIPAYAYGSDSGAGAAKTASGLSMLMNSASKGIKRMISNIDIAVRSTVERFYVHNMVFDPDKSIKGDAKVVALGAMKLIQKEDLARRRMEMMQFTANPIDMQILGVEGRADQLREAMDTLDYEKNPVPDKEKIMQMVQQQQAAGQPQEVAA
ncbi:hypothetical protein A9Q81_11700 [Gammaproteobacteria bacterium 42_54_T18]|nr:hypothetical protein A9Q81_11700 [Gammaproteobacteria bacterium 42_54_T18]